MVSVNSSNYIAGRFLILDIEIVRAEISQQRLFPAFQHTDFIESKADPNSQACQPPDFHHQAILTLSQLHE